LESFAVNAERRHEEVHRDMHLRALEMGQQSPRRNLNIEQPRRRLNYPAEEKHMLGRSFTYPTYRTIASSFNLPREPSDLAEHFLPKAAERIRARQEPNTPHLERGLVKNGRMRHEPRENPRGHLKARGEAEVTVGAPDRNPSSKSERSTPSRQRLVASAPERIVDD